MTDQSVAARKSPLAQEAIGRNVKKLEKRVQKSVETWLTARRRQGRRLLSYYASFSQPRRLATALHRHRRKSASMFRPILVFPLLLLVTTSWMAGTPIHNASAHGQTSALLDATNHYLELSITPPVATLGSLVTLRISYHNVGEPLTYFGAIPAESVTSEPEISSPCFDCSVITFRTLAKGTVTFDATASGEILDEGCNCWVFTMVSDNGPAVLHIVDQAWTVFLPVIQR